MAQKTVIQMVQKTDTQMARQKAVHWALRLGNSTVPPKAAHLAVQRVRRMALKMARQSVRH
jgi:hypothetical protein